jgi:hypothetical protein
MQRLQEVKLSPEEGLALVQRLEHDTCSAADRHLLAQVVRATHAFQALLADAIAPARSTPQRTAKRKRQLAQASRRRNRR